MQDFRKIQGQDNVQKSRVTLNGNFETLASNFAGTDFPTANLYVGMKCYRTDRQATFTLRQLDPIRWDEDSLGALKNACNITLAGKVQSTVVAFDGTSDIAIRVTQVEADSCTGNAATASVAHTVKGVISSQNAPRHVWFSGVNNEAQREYANNFIYNPATGTLAVPYIEGTLKGEAATAQHPVGFSSASFENAGWGNQDGRTLATWYSSQGGAVDFRENGSKINVKIDGCFFQEEGQYKVVDSRGGMFTGALYAPAFGVNEGNYIGNTAHDTGDAITHGGANINIASWYGVGFYSSYRQAYTGTMDLRTGDWRTVGAMTANRFYADDWFRATGNCGLYFENHGGGFYMYDNEWIRSFGGKSIYCDNRIRSALFQVQDNGGIQFLKNGNPFRSFWLDKNLDRITTDAAMSATHYIASTYMESPTYYTSDWFRTRSNGGLYFERWGGGWYMEDATWLRSFNNKSIYTAGVMKADGGFRGKATNAGWADGAQWAKTAGRADGAGWADNAGHANKADNAGWADGAEYSNRAVRVENDYRNMRFHWSGQGGQPSWLWGGNDGENMYVYNPFNFTVNRANAASRADSAARADNANNLQNWSLQRILDEIKQRSPQISVLTGEIAHGGIIPLPNGFAESQCKWIVSVKHDNPNRVTWDPNEYDYNLVYSFKCYTEGRKVICKVEHDRHRGDTEHFGIANYMIIGVK